MQKAGKVPLRSRIISGSGSDNCFRAIILLLVIQAVWIAASARYPMAFDEDYHFGLIRFYASHINPFLSTQPKSADVLGAMFRDPSYLYHYLFSIIYRFIYLFTHNQTSIVIVLRALNIALFSMALVVFRRLLGRLGSSPALTNIVILLFVLIPVVPLLAGQINYDNLFIPVVALFCLWSVQFNDILLKERRIDTAKLLSLCTLALLGCLIKYAFFPFAAAAVVYMVFSLGFTFKGWRPFWQSITRGMHLLSKRARLLRIMLLLIALLLFTQRYGINLIRYHTPLPDCGRVLTVQRCKSYGPWIRDYELEETKSSVANRTPVHYMSEWIYGMWLRLFFAVDGPGTQNETRGPLLLPAVGATLFGISSLVLIIVFARRIFATKVQHWLPVLLMIVLYVTALWVDGYGAFRRTGQPVAINGRYLLAVLPIVLLLAAQGWRQLLHRSEVVKVVTASLAVLCLLWGGGVLTFILRSSDTWYWPSAAIRHSNYDVRTTIGPIVPGYSNPILFLD